MVTTAQKPDKKVMTDLVNTLASLSKDGHISNREMTQLKVYLKRVLKSSKVTNSEIQELERQVENAANEAGMNSDQKKMLVSRMSAVARSLQQKQRK